MKEDINKNRLNKIWKIIKKHPLSSFYIIAMACSVLICGSVTGVLAWSIVVIPVTLIGDIYIRFIAKLLREIVIDIRCILK